MQLVKMYVKPGFALCVEEVSIEMSSSASLVSTVYPVSGVSVICVVMEDLLCYISVPILCVLTLCK